MPHFQVIEGIKPKKFKIALTEQTPSKVQAKDLRKSLNSIGLTCEETKIENLEKSKADVVSKFEDGAIKSFGIYEEEENADILRLMYSDEDLELAEKVKIFNEFYNEVALGSYKPSTSALGYATDLEIVQNPRNYEFLKAYYDDFICADEGPNTYTGIYETVEGIKGLFIESAYTISSLVNGKLSKEDVEAFFNNIIKPVEDKSLKDYAPDEETRVIFLVDEYENGEAEGIGVLTLNYRLQIKDYKKKNKGETKHDTKLTISARCVTYTDVDILAKHVAAVREHFKNSKYILRIPPKPTEIIVYDSLPSANEETFRHGYQFYADEEYLYAIIFYRADLDLIGIMDNTQSDVQTTYTTSITSGFTNTISTGITQEYSCEINANVVKAGIKVGFNVTMSEQWNESTTESISYSVPGGKKAYLYQGYMHNDILRMSAKTGKFEYVDAGRFLTNFVMTSQEALHSN